MIVTMALINCPECSKEISDKVTACPSCGYPLADKTNKSDAVQVSIKIKKTELGERTRKKASGIALLISGIFLFIIGLPLLVIALGIPFLIVGVVLMGIGISRIKWKCQATCPYCDFKMLVYPTITSLKCDACGKTSVKKGNYLETVPD